MFKIFIFFNIQFIKPYGLVQAIIPKYSKTTAYKQASYLAKQKQVKHINKNQELSNLNEKTKGNDN